MKRILLSISLVASIFVLAACGKKTTDTSVVTPPNDTDPVAVVAQDVVQNGSTV
jgi:predicted small lipoprotein YifL